jgi:hypothetical protein
LIFFLAVLEKEEQGAPESVDYYSDEDDENESWHELDSVFQTSISIKKLVDLDGKQLRSEMKIDEKDIEHSMIQECDPFEDVEDRNEEYEGYMGNSVRLHCGIVEVCLKN